MGCPLPPAVSGLAQPRSQDTGLTSEASPEGAQVSRRGLASVLVSDLSPGLGPLSRVYGNGSRPAMVALDRARAGHPQLPCLFLQEVRWGGSFVFLRKPPPPSNVSGFCPMAKCLGSFLSSAPPVLVGQSLGTQAPAPRPLPSPSPVAEARGGPSRRLAVLGVAPTLSHPLGPQGRPIQRRHGRRTWG